jgi:hypothetical protein
MKRRYLFAIPVIALAGAALYLYGGHVVPASQPPLAELRPENFSEFASAFNAAKDDTKVLLLLSPT